MTGVRVGGKEPGRAASVAFPEVKLEIWGEAAAKPDKTQATRWWSSEWQCPLSQEQLTDPLAIGPSEFLSLVPVAHMLLSLRAEQGETVHSTQGWTWKKHSILCFSSHLLDNCLSRLGKSALDFKSEIFEFSLSHTPHLKTHAEFCAYEHLLRKTALSRSQNCSRLETFKNTELSGC